MTLGMFLPWVRSSGWKSSPSSTPRPLSCTSSLSTLQEVRWISQGRGGAGTSPQKSGPPLQPLLPTLSQGKGY